MESLYEREVQSNVEHTAQCAPASLLLRWWARAATPLAENRRPCVLSRRSEF